MRRARTSSQSACHALALGLWELGQGGFVAKAGEVAVPLPVLHHPPELGTVGRLAALPLFATHSQVGAEPVEGLLA